MRILVKETKKTTKEIFKNFIIGKQQEGKIWKYLTSKIVKLYSKSLLEILFNIIKENVGMPFSDDFYIIPS